MTNFELFLLALSILNFAIAFTALHRNRELAELLSSVARNCVTNLELILALNSSIGNKLEIDEIKKFMKDGTIETIKGEDINENLR